MPTEEELFEKVFSSTLKFLDSKKPLQIPKFKSDESKTVIIGKAQIIVMKEGKEEKFDVTFHQTWKPEHGWRLDKTTVQPQSQSLVQTIQPLKFIHVHDS